MNMKSLMQNLKMPFLLKNPKISNNIKKILGLDSYYRIQLENWLAQIDIEGGTVLDIGGSLKPVKGRTRLWEADEYYILDSRLQNRVEPDFNLDLNSLVRYPKRAWRYGVEEGVLPAKLTSLKPNTIFCLEVMEYVLSPQNAVSFMYDLLGGKGNLYITFPSIYPVHEPSAHDYLRYTKAAITKLLKDAGFSTWEITPRKATRGKSALLDFYVREKMKGVKDEEVLCEIGYLVRAFK